MGMRAHNSPEDGRTVARKVYTERQVKEHLPEIHSTKAKTKLEIDALSIHAEKTQLFFC